MMMMMTKNINDSTDHDDAEVENGPEAGEVFLEAKSHPLEEHLDCEDDRIKDIQDVQDVLQARLLVQIDVLKTLQHTIQYNICPQSTATWKQGIQYNTIQNRVDVNAVKRKLRML